MFTNHQLQLYRQLRDFNTSTETGELQSVSGLTAHADSLSVISSIFKATLLISADLKSFKFHQFFITMYRNPSLNSYTDSDIFYVEHSPPERSPIQNNTPVSLNSTQVSETMDPETITISSVASPEPQRVTLDSDSYEPTFLYAFGTQQPAVPPCLNDLNLPPNPFNVQCVGNYGRHSTRTRRQPSITGVVRSVSNLNAPNELEHD